MLDADFPIMKMVKEITSKESTDSSGALCFEMIFHFHDGRKKAVTCGGPSITEDRARTHAIQRMQQWYQDFYKATP